MTNLLHLVTTFRSGRPLTLAGALLARRLVPTLAKLRLLALLPLLALLASCSTVTTDVPTSITSSSARLGGTGVSNDAGANISERGVRYSTQSPSLSSPGTTTITMAGTGDGPFSQVVTGLLPNQLYYVQAYIVNSSNLGGFYNYGPIRQFRTNIAAPVVTAPANNSSIATPTPTYGGTAPGGSTVSVYVDGNATPIGTTTATSAGNWTLLQPTALAQGAHTVNATALSNGLGVSDKSNTNTFTIDTVPPSVAINSSAGASGGTTSTTPIPFTVTFSKSVTGFSAAGVTVTNGTVSGFTAVSGTTYTFSVTPTTAGTVTTVNVAANVVQDAAGNGNTAAASPYSLTYVPIATVVSVTGLTPSPTATAQVSYQVTFSGSVTGVTASNFSLTTTGAVSGASVASVAAASGSTYMVAVNTGTGDGTLRLNVANATGISPAITNTPFTGGTTYTITKRFTANPFLSVQGTGSPSGGNDVTAFVDVVQVLSGGSPFANALQNPSFETHDPLSNGNYGYNPTGGSWTFNSLSGIAESGSAFTPITPIPGGIAVAFVQSNIGSNGSITQNLALPTGSNYQVSFQAAQRNCCSATLDQGLSVFLNGVFLGIIQPANNNLYSTFTSATFSVAAPALTATITSTTAANGGSTGTSPIAYSVTFSQSVGTSFTASDVSVTNGAISGFAGSGTTYTFNVTPAGNGAVTVNVPANVAQDDNNTGNTAATQYSITYQPSTLSWTGLVSTDWFTAGNWSAGVPTSVVDVIITAAAPNMPLIAAGTATTKSLTLNAGATLTQSGGTLDVRADLTNNGSLSATGGAVVLGSTTLASVLGSSNTRFWNLTTGSSGAQSGTSALTSVQRLFTLNGNFSTQGNPLTLESNASATALVVNNASNAIIGNVTVQRYIAQDLNAGLGYRHFSAPISTATVANLATGSFTPLVNGTYNTSATPTAVTPFPTVYGYDQARLATATNNLVAFDKGWFSPNSLGDALTVGQGYTVNLAANQTLSVTGPQNNGNVALSLSRNSGATGATAIDAGWQLLGNPYPSPLDYSLVAPVDRIGLDAAIYVFESTSQYVGSYRANVNGVGGNANSPNAVLALGQGFFVRVSNGQTSSTLRLRNSHRVTAYQNPVYHRTTETRPLVQLDLHSATGTDPVYVYFENGATAGVDREFDAVKLPNSNGLNVSAETGGQRLAINALPTLGTAIVTVPLTVGVPAAGSFSFNASQLLNLGTTPVYLRDRQTGVVVDLARQSSYSFVVSNASALISGRFELVFAPQAPLATAPAALAAQVGVYPNPATTTAFVELPAALGRVVVAAELVDALGRTVRTQSLPAQGAAAHRLDLANLATGLYTLHLNTSAGVVVKKLVVQ